MNGFFFKYYMFMFIILLLYEVCLKMSRSNFGMSAKYPSTATIAASFDVKCFLDRNFQTYFNPLNFTNVKKTLVCLKRSKYPSKILFTNKGTVSQKIKQKIFILFFQILIHFTTVFINSNNF